MPLDLARMKIIDYPDPRLKKKCAPVETIDEETRRLAARMLELMHAEKGIGLAAPQVGVLRRMFVCNLTGKPNDDRVFINPSLAEFAGDIESEEGCLSIPDVTVQLHRHARCVIAAQDLSGKAVRLEGEGLAARCWQHECDHLDGRLIIDRMSEADKIANRKALRTLERKYKGKAAG